MLGILCGRQAAIQPPSQGVSIKRSFSLKNKKSFSTDCEHCPPVGWGWIYMPVKYILSIE